MKAFIALLFMAVGFSAFAQSEEFLDQDRAKRFTCEYRKQLAEHIVVISAKTSKQEFMRLNPFPHSWSDEQATVAGIMVDDAYEWAGSPKEFGKKVFDSCMSG